MNAIREYLIVGAGLLVLIPAAGSGPAGLVLLALVASLGMHVVDKALLRLSGGDWLTTALLVTAMTRMLAAVGAAVLLFVGTGWLAGVAFAVLWIVFYAARQTDHVRDEDRLRRVRQEVLALIDRRVSGVITEEQLTARASQLLERDVPRVAVSNEKLAAVLLDGSGYSADHQRRLADLVAAYAKRTSRFGTSELLRAAQNARR